MQIELTSSTTSKIEISTFERYFPLTFWIGIGLSVSSSIFIGASFIIKKVALLRLSKTGTRAGEGGYGYLKDSFWWAGLVSMGIGEGANFVAYTFAPASVVSTLGVLSVLVATVLSSQFLDEKLNFLGKIGCFLCAIGSIVIVIHAPENQEVKDIADLEKRMFDPLFLVYLCIVIIFSLILIFYCRPKCATNSTKTLLIWLGVCSMVGSLSVMFCKGSGLAISNTIEGHNELTNYLTWVCLGGLAVCVSVQMNFLNKALDTFSTAIVTPIYYVFFTTCVISASAILFHEFDALATNDWLGLFCGFAIVLAAIFLLHFCKNYDITFANLAHQVVMTREQDGKGGSVSIGGSYYKPVSLAETPILVDSEEILSKYDFQDSDSRKSSCSSQGSYGATQTTLPQLTSSSILVVTPKLVNPETNLHS